MKKLILSFIFPAYFNAQIQMNKTPVTHVVGEVKQKGIFYAGVHKEYFEGETDTTYSLLFLNNKYENIIDLKRIRFKNDSNTVGQLYSILKKSFARAEFKASFNLGDKPVITELFRSAAGPRIIIYVDGGYVSLSENEVDKIFGK